MNATTTWARTLLATAILMAPMLAQAQDATPRPADAAYRPTWQDVVSPEAQLVLANMSRYMRGLQSFSIEADSSRDEVAARGYKLQHNEHSSLLVQRPDRLRASISGDLRNRRFVYDGSKLAIYSSDDEAYVRVDAPASIGKLMYMLMDAGIEMPMIDILYQAAEGTLAEGVQGGILVGTATIDGVACDHLAFRQPNLDWQIWVAKGAQPVPRKMLITTRYEVGDPQFQATLRWNFAPKIDASSFRFEPPKGAAELIYSAPAGAP